MLNGSLALAADREAVERLRARSPNWTLTPQTLSPTGKESLSSPENAFWPNPPPLTLVSPEHETETLADAGAAKVLLSFQYSTPSTVPSKEAAAKASIVIPSKQTALTAANHLAPRGPLATKRTYTNDPSASRKRRFSAGVP